MLKTWTNIAKKFLTDEEGQSTTEYILILAVVVMIAMKFKNQIGSRIDSATSQIGGNIDNALRIE
jgi:pilus assembly protein Flp/PilA